MSTGESTPNPAQSRRWLPLATPTVRSMILTWVIIVVAGYVLHVTTTRKSDELQKSLTSTQSSLNDLDQRLRQGDNTAIAEIEAMRKRVEDFDRVLGAQREQFRQLSDRADEAQSRKAVERSKVAVLQAEVSSARNRLKELKKLHAGWAARSSSLLTAEPGQRIAASANHLALVVDLLDRERPTDTDLQRWELQLEALAAPLEAIPQDRQSEITISSEHSQALRDLSEQITKAVVSYEQQELLLEAVLRETAAVVPTTVTLEAAIRDHEAMAQLELAEKLSQAREEARLSAEKAQAERLAELEKEIVIAAGMAQEAALLAKRAQTEQLGRAELDRIAEETKVKEAHKRAEIADLKEEATQIEEAIKAAALEREFERDLPEIKSLLSAFVAPGFKYRTDNAKGPASLAHISSQRSLEHTATGSAQMAFLANSSDRPPGGLRNPCPPDSIRRAQDLLIKYGTLMVEKKMLDP